MKKNNYIFESERAYICVFRLSSLMRRKFIIFGFGTINSVVFFNFQFPFRIYFYFHTIANKTRMVVK